MKLLKTFFLACAACTIFVGSAFSAGIDLPPIPAPKTVAPSVEDKWPDGKLQRKVDFLENGVKVITSYDHDGKTMLIKQEFRKDGTLSYQKHRMVDGSTLAVRFKVGGDKQMERAYDATSGAFTLKHYRTGKSTAVWFQSSMNLTKDGATWQYFAKDGSSAKRYIDGDNMTVTIIDDKGKTKYTQEWKNVAGKWTLQSASDPATSKRFTFSTDASGKLSQRAVDYLKPDGSLDHTDPASKLLAPASWLGEYAENDDPTVPE